MKHNIMLVSFIVAFVVLNVIISVQNQMTSSKLSHLFNISSAEAENSQTKWIKRAVRYDCVYYVMNVANGCTNCASDCKAEQVPLDSPDVSNCTEDITCCSVVPGWSAIFGPCTNSTN